MSLRNCVVDITFDWDLQCKIRLYESRLRVEALRHVNYSSRQGSKPRQKSYRAIVHEFCRDFEPWFKLYTLG